ncbi:FHA domain-containing protein [Planctomyces sp. SH-PL62]|uniref:FHA domain-containing protein n=1 Tax=Planctomyces sp. SH-PL62 TaxID=1636152 RepID=UPI00078EBF70|nr:FHA domain-containing protein [Planctomyces sp. SH-PL62]AMV36643.1 FHA domain protein [Planctomyces sp. SH-PL62]
MAQGELTLATDANATRKPRSVRLAASPDATMPDRRLEDWITVNLDPEVERPATNLWTQIVGNLPTARRNPRSGGRPEKGHKSRGCWERFNVVYKRGVTIVRLTDRSLVQQADINELADDLRDLIDVGNHRIILNFAKVERLGSWIVAAVVEAHRRCEAAEGGRLKICEVEPRLAEIFHLIGMGRRIVACPDEQQAVDGAWPGASPPRPLPVDILEALVSASALPPIRGGGPAAADDDLPAIDLEPVEEPRASRPRPEGDLRGKVWLRVECAGFEARMIPVTRRRFVIGRDRGSHLRLGSAKVSKRHATIEIRGDRAFLRDLGSTNGTQLNGETIQDAEAELHTQDRVVVGPAHCRIWVDVSQEEMEHLGAIEPTWATAEVTPDEAEEPEPDSDSPATAEVAAYDPDDDAPGSRIKHEVVQGILVVTPVLTDLDDEAANEALRLRLIELAEQPLPRQVVLDLEFVGRLSRRTIGVILAHHLRLDQAGGGVRLCEIHPRIMALLDQVRLTMLVDCYPCLDEAVLAAWHTPARSTSG